MHNRGRDGLPDASGEYSRGRVAAGSSEVVAFPAGELDYTVQGGVSGTVHFGIAPVAENVLVVQLLDPVPPIFFTG